MHLTIMKRLLFLFFMLVVGTTAWAKAEWQVLENIQLAAKPLDVMVAADNRRIYLLDDQGQIAIYGIDGQLQETITVGRDVDQIKAGPREDLVFLLSQARQTVQLISIDVVENFNTRTSPSKGPADAPVTIAVFSDFQ